MFGLKSRHIIFFCASFLAKNALAQFPLPSVNLPQWIRSSNNGPQYQRIPEWVTLVKQGLEWRKAGKLENAESAFKPALEKLKEQEGKSDPEVIQYGLVRVDMLLAYGDTLNKLNRPDEAIPLLQQAAAIEQDDLERRSKRAQPSMSYFDAMAAMQATMSNAMNMAKGLNRRLMIVETDDASTIDELLTEHLPDTLLPSLLLADSYSRKGDKASVHRLFDEPFQAYLRRQRENSNPDARFNLDLAIESACLRFALVLARLGPSPQMEQAFRCALEINLANQKTFGTSATVGSIQESMASQRRLFVGAYADQVVRNAPKDHTAHRRLVELIADSKGLHNRYSHKVRQIIFHADNSILKSLRPQFIELEKARKQLPTSGPQSVPAMAQWENSRAALMQQALFQLKEEGLGDIFIDGSKLLAKAQRRLAGQALIGFSIYKPVNLVTMQVQPGRVLRYTVTQGTVEIQDIGGQKDFERLVYLWRSSVAVNKGDPDSELSQRLLGGVSAEIVNSKSWIIDPDGVIALVPFEALKDPNGNLVISKRTVRYITSIASFASASSVNSKSSPTAVVVADPLLSGTLGVDALSPVVRSVPTAGGALIENFQFNQLPHTAIAASKVQDAFRRLGISADMRLGRQATLDAMSFTTSPRYLHIATHGIYMAPGTDRNSREFIRVATVIPGMQSALVFTPNANGAVFTGADFARLPLKGTELVVLSACDTGNGVLNVGEGVESLRMAVEEAGAKSSVTSLWPVPSEATAELMGAFYDELGKGVSKPEALRNAKLQLMQMRPEPLNWAGFLLAGEP